MAAAQPLQWRRRFPSRAVRRLGWFTMASAAIVAGMWVLFGTEPERLASGERNPLAVLPYATTVLLVVAAIPLVLVAIRRPVVVADHYGLTVRPGCLRTLLLPWAEVAEVAAVMVRGEPLLVVRYGRPGRYGPVGGDQPRWFDQAVLRSGGGALAGYQLAVRMDEFAGDPSQRLAILAAVAPGQVRFIDST